MMKSAPLALSLAASIAIVSGCSDRPPTTAGHRRPGGPPPIDQGLRGGRLFISPMGEPFRGTGDGRAPEAAWFAGADRNGDGRLTSAEFAADAARFFAILDSDHDGEIGPSEIEHYEQVLVPEIATGGGLAGAGGGGRRGRPGGHGGGHGGGRSGGGHGGPGGGGFGGGGPGEGEGGGDSGGGRQPVADTGLRGAGRFGYIGLPEPVIAADTNFNRGVSAQEFNQAAVQRFALLDLNHDGAIMPGELPKLHNGGGRPGRPPRGD